MEIVPISCILFRPTNGSRFYNFDMPRSCCVSGCKAIGKSDGFRAHKFPADPKYRSIWTEQIRQTNPTWPGPSNKYVFICNAHFEPTCYDGVLYSTFDIDMRPKLRRDAIPTIFPALEKGPQDPQEEFTRRERTRILDKVLGATGQQDAAGEESYTNEPFPISLHVCDEEETEHTFQKIIPLNDTTALQTDHNEGEHLEDEIRCFASSSLSEGTNVDLPSNNARLQDVMNSSENSDWCLATDKQHSEPDRLVHKSSSTASVLGGVKHIGNRGKSHVQIHESPVNTTKKKNWSCKMKGGPCPARNLQQQGGATEVICVVVKKVTHYVRVQEPPTNGDQLSTPRDQQRVSQEGQVSKSPGLVRSSPGKTQSDLLRQDPEVMQSSGDGNDAVISDDDDFEEEEDEEDDLEMEDDSNDEDYVPEIKVRSSKKQRQGGKSLRPVRTRQKAPWDKETTEDGQEGTQEAFEEDADEDDDLPSSEVEDDTLSSSEDSDEEKQGRKKPGKQKQKKPNKPTYVRLAVQFSHLPKMYECKTCQEKFQEADDIRTHYTNTHLTVSDKTSSTEQEECTAEIKLSLSVQNDICDIATELRQCRKCKEFVENMHKHYRIHIKRNFKCETCGQGFISRSGLAQHQLVHESIEKRKRLKCSDCDKSFTTQAALNSHYKTIHCQGGQKRFVCEQCGKQFIRAVHLNIHKSIHLKEKPFKCSECGRGFTQKSNMLHHMRMHTGDRPYQCNICQKAFNHNISLKTHQKKAHKIDWWKDKNKSTIS